MKLFNIKSQRMVKRLQRQTSRITYRFQDVDQNKYRKYIFKQENSYSHVTLLYDVKIPQLCH